MDKKYKQAVGFHIIPALINIAGSVYLFINAGRSEFNGYFMGTILGILLSLVWILQVKRALGAHAIKLLKLTFTGFLIKFIVFMIFIAVIYNFFQFNRVYFAVSFFIALFLSAVIEILFYSSLINEEK